MKKHRDILFINAAIIIIALLLNFFAVIAEKNNQHTSDIFGRYAISGIVILLLGILNILSGILYITMRSDRGKWLLLSGALILLIGFSVCSIH